MRVGIVCNLNHNFNIAISNYYYGLNNIFDNVKVVNSEFDIEKNSISRYNKTYY